MILTTLFVPDMQYWLCLGSFKTLIYNIESALYQPTKSYKEKRCYGTAIDKHTNEIFFVRYWNA